MKFKSWTAGIAALTLAAAPSFAAENAEQWSYDQHVNPVSNESPLVLGQGSSGGGILSGFGSGLVENFSLANRLGVDAFDIGGWTQIGYTSEPTLLASLDPDPVNSGASFNNIEDQINLHQQYFYIGKAADGSNGLDFGFRAEFIYGIDAQDTQSFGNPGDEFDNGFDNGIHGWAIPQLYAEVAAGDFSVIIGHFYTLVGYEVVTAPDNFFFSHALTQFNAEPFTHTGVLSTYSGFENLTIYNGWTLGWDTGFTNANSGNSYLGGFSANLSDSVTLTYINTYGNFGNRGGVGQDDSYSHSVVVDVALTDDWNYVFQSDLVDTDSVAGTAANDQIGINQYLFYQYNDYVSFGTRIEWFKSDGTSFYNYTSGANIKLLDNLVIRPEYRQDWSPGNNFDEEIGAMDVILTY